MARFEAKKKAASGGLVGWFWFAAVRIGVDADRRSAAPCAMLIGLASIQAASRLVGIACRLDRGRQHSTERRRDCRTVVGAVKDESWIVFGGMAVAGDPAIDPSSIRVAARLVGDGRHPDRQWVHSAERKDN